MTDTPDIAEVGRRRLIWFSSGAASAVTAKLVLRDHPDAEVVQCDTGSEDDDNHRFAADCVRWFNAPVITLKSDEYQDTFDCWEKTGWMSGPKGARCTGEMKVAPRLAYQRPNDIHVFGYTADHLDVERARRLRETYPELTVETPLIDRGITKAGCLAIIEGAGIALPRTYAMGFPNANCLKTGCAKAVSPAYWALYRKCFPDNFARTAALCRKLGVRLAILGQEKDEDGKARNIRAFIDDIPLDQPTLNPIAPACDFLCHIAEQDIAA